MGGDTLTQCVRCCTREPDLKEWSLALLQGAQELAVVLGLGTPNTVLTEFPSGRPMGRAAGTTDVSIAFQDHKGAACLPVDTQSRER